MIWLMVVVDRVAGGRCSLGWVDGVVEASPVDRALGGVSGRARDVELLQCWLSGELGVVERVWRAGAMIGSRGAAPADLDRFTEAMMVAACPRASVWDPVWVWHHQMGPTNLWVAELLAERMRLRPGMRVLDMGCGAAATSLFLAMEYGVDVWAADLWIDPTDNLARIAEAELTGGGVVGRRAGR